MEKVGLFRPDLIFMDIRLPDGSGLELTRKIIGIYPDTKAIIMTGHESMGYQQLAAQYGAKGFFYKGEVTGKDILALVNPFGLLKEMEVENRQKVLHADIRYGIGRIGL